MKLLGQNIQRTVFVSCREIQEQYGSMKRSQSMLDITCNMFVCFIQDGVDIRMCQQSIHCGSTCRVVRCSSFNE